MLRINGQNSTSFGYASSAAGRVQFNALSMPVEFYVWATADCYVSIDRNVTSATASDYPIQAYGLPVLIGVSGEVSTVGGRVHVSALSVAGGASGTTYAMPIQR